MALAVAAIQADVQRLGADAPALVVEQSIVATLRAGELTLTGTDFREASAGSAVLFDYGPRSATVTSDSPLVEHWQSSRIEISIPWEVVSGELRVVVDGVASDPVELLVFDYDSVDIPISPGTNDRPLAVAVGEDGTAWLNQEFHLQLKASYPDGSYQAIDIPQAEGPGIFALNLQGDHRSRISWIAAGITVEDSGVVWFTQGGAGFYEGTHLNTSRLVRYSPGNGTFSCYIVPTDNAQVMDVLMDEERGMVWYTETGFEAGAAISGFRPEMLSSDCLADPYTVTERPPICEDASLGCHERFRLPVAHSYPAQLAMDDNGNIWFTEFWNGSIGRLNPATGEIVEFPLPISTGGQGPGLIVGSGPWSIEFDNTGDIWINELMDAAILRVDLSRIDDPDCRGLNPSGANPCITEVFVGSDGFDGKIIESLSIGTDDRVWFAVTQWPDATVPAHLGFIEPTVGTAVMLSKSPLVNWVSGVGHDPVLNDVWLAQPGPDRKLGRLHLLTAGQEGEAVDCSPSDLEACVDLDTDGDGCTDAQELGPDERLGGRRDPENFWDFFDTPNRNGGRDGEIDLPNDLLSVVMRINANDSNGNAEINRYSDPKSPITADITAYHPAFDRLPPQGGDPWDLGPPDGYIGLLDVLGVILQYGHSCSGSN
ncbi:MAG: hypothetical protein IIC91_14890 [Chloroflexi bacterium]|nr:hypothetical protein [Chloroflexota bacterium]